jgi:Fe(3+) dicitrate transport protein
MKNTFYILLIFFCITILSSQNAKLPAKGAKVSVKEAKTTQKEAKEAESPAKDLESPKEAKSTETEPNPNLTESKEAKSESTAKDSTESVEEEQKLTEEQKAKLKNSGGIEIKGERNPSSVGYYDDVKGTSIYAGKKNEVIDLNKTNANLAVNNSRQVYAKIPGIQIWENDGSGIQTGIATRGLNPNRMWEFNVRQNGYDIASDVFGYPEAYYTPPLEAVEKIEIIRGAGALQYGPQFGGMVNFVTKKANPNKPFQVETRQTGGSYNLFNSYNSVSGTSGRISYFVFYHNRSADGWRNNANYKTQTGFINLSYKITDKIKLGIEYTRSQYESRQPGGLTDGQYQYDTVLSNYRTPEMVNQGLLNEVNPRQSARARNWFSAPWNLPVMTLDYEIAEKTKLSVKAFGLVGERNSVGRLGSINQQDLARTGNTAFNIDNEFGARQIDRDLYRNYGIEGRFIHTYTLFGMENTSSFGVRRFIGNTDRFRNSNGTRGIGYTLSETNRVGDFTMRDSELKFQTKNNAVFYEHLLKVNERFSISPGFRYEWIENSVSGHLSTNKSNSSTTTGRILLEDNRTTPILMALPGSVQNKVLLGGIGTQYKITADTNLYANYTQAFRPVLYQDLYQPSTTVDEVDQRLKNSSGYNADAGYRGIIGNFFTFDAGAFQLKYNNRVGVVNGSRRTDINAVFARNQGFQSPNLRTNTGDSLSRGIELFMEYDPITHFFQTTNWGTVSGFVSHARIDAKYVKSSIPVSISNPSLSSIAGNQSGTILLPDDGTIKNLGIVGNRVENAPDRITRLGLTYTLKKIFSVTLQNSQISHIYTDANNSFSPLQGNTLNSNGQLSSLNTNSQIGKLEGYKVSDISFVWNINEIFSIRGGINNLENRVYATRRAGGYPGPGILPADGRTFYLGFGAVF